VFIKEYSWLLAVEVALYIVITMNISSKSSKSGKSRSGKSKSFRYDPNLFLSYDFEEYGDEDIKEPDLPSLGKSSSSRGNSNDYELTVHEKLYQEAKLEPEKKIEKDVLITTLSSDSIRWLKRRRMSDAKHRVAITHYREGQLREIFDGLDFDSQGVIDLEELKSAVQYAEDQLKGKRGPSFKDVGKMFEAMDEDGNGEVDYHEFMCAMTGSSKSLIDIASESDIEKLRAKFKEYAIKKKREHFHKVIGEERPVTSMTTVSAASPTQTHASAAANANGNTTSTAPVSDIEKCKYFTALFNIYGDPASANNFLAFKDTINDNVSLGSSSARVKSIRHQIADEHPSPHIKMAPDSPAQIERILDPFAGLDFESMERNLNPTKKDLFYYQLEGRIRDERRQAFNDLQKDSEARDMENRVLHEKQYILEVRRPGPYDCGARHLKEKRDQLEQQKLEQQKHRHHPHNGSLSPIKAVGLTVKARMEARLAATKDVKAIRKQRQQSQRTDTGGSDGGLFFNFGELLDGIVEADETDANMDDGSPVENVISFDEYQSIDLSNIPRMSSSIPASALASARNSTPNTKPPSRNANSSRGGYTSRYNSNKGVLQALSKQKQDFLQDAVGKQQRQETVDKYVLELDSFDNDRRSVGLFTDREVKKQQQHKHAVAQRKKILEPIPTRRSEDNIKSVLLNCFPADNRSMSASMSALPPNAWSGGRNLQGSQSQTVF
jgi:Ca2+-binding EF-hand superfamily protein